MGQTSRFRPRRPRQLAKLAESDRYRREIDSFCLLSMRIARSGSRGPGGPRAIASKKPSGAPAPRRSPPSWICLLLTHRSDPGASRRSATIP
jgi:hypothetical protein